MSLKFQIEQLAKAMEAETDWGQFMSLRDELSDLGFEAEERIFELEVGPPPTPQIRKAITIVKREIQQSGDFDELNEAQRRLEELMDRADARFRELCPES